jgi:hypothetical protein
MQFLNEQPRMKRKGNAIHKFAINDFKEPDDTMKSKINKGISDSLGEQVVLLAKYKQMFNTIKLHDSFQ